MPPVPVPRPLPETLYRAAEVRALDAEAIRNHRLPGSLLMERAGGRAYRALRRCWPSARAVHVVCGAGNNGGDGFVVARLAREDGLAVRVHVLGDLGRLGDDARSMLARLGPLGIEPRPFAPGALAGAQVIVDALLGTGLARPLRAEWAEAVEALNAAAVPVLALDVPSGLDADTGRILGAAVEADVTVTFIGLKRGLLTGAGPAHCGALVFEDLSVPPAVYDVVEAGAQRIDRRLLARLGPRARTAHKGTYGHVLVLGGETGYSGAARLAGEAAARSGAGLVSVGTRAVHAGYVNLARPELMVRGVESHDALAELAARATVIAVGPGLGTGRWGRTMLAAALELGRPLVVDADALNLLARSPRRHDGWILTPHPAEAGRLLGISAGAVQDDRFAAARAIVDRYGGVCVLKGAGTVITDAAGPFWVCSDGNPGLASGGTGDVLTGIVAAFVAQGHGLLAAARIGVCAHAAAGDRAARDGERGMLAGDVIAELRAVLNDAR